MKIRPRMSFGGSGSGFTIVEVVVAMGLLLLGMSSILALLSYGAGMTRTAQLRTAGASAVEAIVADMEEGLFPLVLHEEAFAPVAGEPEAIEDRAVPGHPGITYSAVAEPHPDQLARPGGPLEYKVDVVMKWQAGGQARVRRFTALLLREVPFGERLRRQFVEQLDPAPAVSPSEEESQ